MGKQIHLNERQYELLQLIEKCKEHNPSELLVKQGYVNFKLINEIEKGIDYNGFYCKPSFYIPDEVYVKRNTINLNEGLIKTYPSSKLIKTIILSLKQGNAYCTDKQFHCNNLDSKTGVASSIIFEYPRSLYTKEIEDIIQHICETCGYFIALKRTIAHNANDNELFIFLQIEPKYHTSGTIPVIGENLFHVTTRKLGEKILNQGFKPNTADKRQQFSFQYAPRVYFFTEGNIPQMVDYMHNAGKLNITGEHNPNHMFRIFVIDTKKIPNIKFFYEPDIIQQNAVYTYENVPKDSICHYQDVDDETIYKSDPWN